MLTRFVRIQLVVFAIGSMVGVVVMALVYMTIPTLLGIGRLTVTLELPESGGLYRFGNVTMRGVQIGKVTDVDIGERNNRAVATLSLDRSPRIPSDLRAEIRSVSAVGEQYVDLRPRTDSGPYLQNGAVISAHQVVLPHPVGPMLDQTSALLSSIPQDGLGRLFDETSKALDGADYDLSSLNDSATKLSAAMKSVAGESKSLIDDSSPLLDSQDQSTDALRHWTQSLAGITGQVRTNDPQVRSLLTEGPLTAQEVSKLLEQVKPTLPVLLANLTSISQVAVTYHAGLEQLLVLLPPYVAAQQSYGLPWNNPVGLPIGDFTLNIADPPVCTVGFLPPSSWRSPSDTSDIDTPDGLYCKLPQDSPISVRGARNSPCADKPGKRAPTVQICKSDKPFQPLAMREHALGPYPMDPNLIAQGIPPDSRIDPGASLYGPIAGSPALPVDGAAPPPPADAQPQTEPPPHAEAPAPPPGSSPATGDDISSPPPTTAPASVVITQYDPSTGQYVAPNGKVMKQADLAGPAMSWQQLILRA